MISGSTAGLLGVEPAGGAGLAHPAVANAEDVGDPDWGTSSDRIVTRR
jgi:hypothetical protein